MPVRVAIDGRYIQDHFPGIGRYTFNLIRHLAAIGDDQFVVLHNPALRNSHYNISSLAQSNVSLVAIGATTFSLGEQWRVPLAALRQHADLLHTPYYIKPYAPAMPSVTTVYDVISARFPGYLPSRRARLVFELTTRLALATSRRVLTLSECSRRDLQKLYGAGPEKVDVTFLAADPCFRPLDRVQCDELRRRLGLPERFALYLGINKPHKNLAMLVEALAIARRHSAARLVIAGPHDPRWPQARDAAARLGLQDDVVFVPNVAGDDLPLLYNLADFFVFPSLYEGFGLPPLEAMACGVPVIASNSSSLPEVTGGAAISLDPHDATAWGEAIANLWESAGQREQMSRRGLARAASFSWHETARRTLQAYREALRS